MVLKRRESISLNTWALEGFLDLLMFSSLNWLLMYRCTAYRPISGTRYIDQDYRLSRAQEQWAPSLIFLVTL
jgi:hypothetical protein